MLLGERESSSYLGLNHVTHSIVPTLERWNEKKLTLTYLYQYLELQRSCIFQKLVKPIYFTSGYPLTWQFHS